MHYWMEKGAPSSKLVMGIPTYGQSFTTLSSYDINSLNVPAMYGGDAGEYTRAKGFLAYYEVCFFSLVHVDVRVNLLVDNYFSC